MRRRTLVLAVALGSAVGSILAVGVHRYGSLMPRAELRGPIRVVDGDTIVIGGVTVRLTGIDAPELRQTCRRAGEDWRCGVEAAAKLRVLVRGGDVSCLRQGTDRNGRVLAVCRSTAEADLGAKLVRDGWAVSYDSTYLSEEREARSAVRGIWTSEFERPREWRRARRAVTED